MSTGPVVLGVALEPAFTGMATVDLTGDLVPLPSAPRYRFDVRHSTAHRRRVRRELLAETVASLSPRPALAVVVTGKSRGAGDLVSDALDVLDGYSIPAVVVPRAEIVRFATGSANAAIHSALALVVRSWQWAWVDNGSPDAGSPVAALAGCLGVSALGGTTPVPSSPGRDRAIASVQWPNPLPQINTTERNPR